MIAADTSAFLAVVLGEDDAHHFLARLQAGPVVVSAVTLVEAAIVAEARQGLDAARDLDLLVAGVVTQIVQVDADNARAAIGAWQRFGKGRHPAGLNFGDCFSYAAATRAHVPLLFKGSDFSQTDVQIVS